MGPAVWVPKLFTKAFGWAFGVAAGGCWDSLLTLTLILCSKNLTACSCCRTDCMVPWVAKPKKTTHMVALWWIWGTEQWTGC